jgi:hypothetical protein
VNIISKTPTKVRNHFALSADYRERPYTAVSANSWNEYFVNKKKMRNISTAKSIVDEMNDGPLHLFDVSPTMLDLPAHEEQGIIVEEMKTNGMETIGQWTQSSVSGSRAFERIAEIHQKKHENALQFRKIRFSPPQVCVDVSNEEAPPQYVSDSNGKPDLPSSGPGKGFMDISSRPCTSQSKGYLSPSIPAYHDLVVDAAELSPIPASHEKESEPKDPQIQSEPIQIQNPAEFVRISLIHGDNEKSKNFIRKNMEKCKYRPETSRSKHVPIAPRSMSAPASRQRPHGKILINPSLFHSELHSEGTSDSQ